MSVLRSISYVFLGLVCLLVLGVFSGFIVCSRYTVSLVNKSSKTWYTSFSSDKKLVELTPGQQVWTSGCMIRLPKNNSPKVTNRAKVIIADTKVETQPMYKTYVIDFDTPTMQSQTITALIQEDGTLTIQEGYVPVLVANQEPTK